MTGLRTLRLASGLVAVVFGLAACQPSLPQPFRPDTVPPLTRPGVRAGLVVEPVAGARDGAALARATAEALQQEDIAATTEPMDGLPYRLIGRAGPDGSGIAIDWTLSTTAGDVKGAVKQKLTAAETIAWRAGDPTLDRTLATTAAGQIAALLSESKAIEPQHPLIAVPEVVGAPGDGPRTLQRSMAYVLGKRGLNVTEDIGAKTEAKLVLLGSMRVVKEKDRAQVEISWTLIHSDGSSVGTVSQANNVPAGLLEGSWGDIAYTIAESAADSVVQLVDQASPPGGPASEAVR